ncbi:hypothetical protein AQI88_08635 [Streptomyces cellostaticus]|uniref:Uncharacterized protein n=1 Tax=Streptomyces cellostaticus TaxID=67285 RepID=A0A101NQI3_9ACTN|nr:hypothetical protein AQI88_08635 [Streptomyces cellostaticus]GHI03872.1 hypothetical protein Scel_21930 [Streptomyces cellostaticus]
MLATGFVTRSPGARGAAKVYATARDPHTITHPDAVPLTCVRLELRPRGTDVTGLHLRAALTRAPCPGT